MAHYIIIGNGVAGTSAAESIRKIDLEGTVTILTEEQYPFYYRIRLPEVVSGHMRAEQLLVRKPKWPDWYTEKNVKVHYNIPVDSIDVSEKLVRPTQGEAFPYDYLLLATGSHCFMPPIGGSDMRGVFTLRTLQDAEAIHAYAKKTRKGVCIGGGLLGLEAANGLRKLGVDSTVIEFLPRLLPRQLDEKGAKVLQRKLEGMGFHFVLDAQTESIAATDASSEPLSDADQSSSEKNRAGQVLLKDGRVYPADIVLVSAGIRPNIQLAEQAGIAVEKGIVTNKFLQTSMPDIYAAGDAIEHAGTMYGIWTAAMQQGRIAGTNMAHAAKGLEAAPYEGTVMVSTLKVVGVDVASAGIIDAESRYESYVYEDDQTYRKLVMHNQSVIGCIFVGNTKRFHEATRMIQSQSKLKEKDIQTMLTTS